MVLTSPSYIGNLKSSISNINLDVTKISAFVTYRFDFMKNKIVFLEFLTFLLKKHRCESFNFLPNLFKFIFLKDSHYVN